MCQIFGEAANVALLNSIVFELQPVIRSCAGNIRARGVFSNYAFQSLLGSYIK